MITAASASIPSPSILATYIRSTILYKKMISWAITAGIESQTIRSSIFPFSSSAVIFFCDPLLFFMSLFSLPSFESARLDKPFLQAVVINSVLCHIAADLIGYRLEIVGSIRHGDAGPDSLQHFDIVVAVPERHRLRPV